LILFTKHIGTNGGKTTLSKKLLAKFPNSYYISQDDFYHKRDEKEKHYEYIPELDSFNFDVISAIDMNKFHKELNRLIRMAKYDIIFMDGILLFEDDKLTKMLDKKYFLHLDKSECARRRQSRNYIIADTSNYFDACCWKEYLKYKQKCESNLKNIIYINGAELPEKIFNFVANDIINYCSDNNNICNNKYIEIESL
jgi:nicotinamide/nicotinate riboside kinase